MSTTDQHSQSTITAPDKKSSCIDHAEYDTENRVLTIRYNSGSVYDYANVPMSIVTDLLNAESRGKFVHAKIQGFYDYTKRG